MPPGLIRLYPSDQRVVENTLVAVHDLFEDSIGAWTDPSTATNWLRQLLPEEIQVARVLTYGYDATATTFFGKDASEQVQRLGENLVHELYADRYPPGAQRHEKRPIIFICHGLGGVLVKKSLIFSQTQTAAKVQHLWDQFVSTYAILFFGTPHGRASSAGWNLLSRLLRPTRNSNVHAIEPPLGLGEETQLFQSITSEFAPLMKSVHMFFFWGDMPTVFGNRSECIVDRSSAVLDSDNAERYCIRATHTDMVKFDSASSPSYRTVIEAISRYCSDAPRHISDRWRQAVPALNQLRASEAYEVAGLVFDIHRGQAVRHRESISQSTARHFYPPTEAAPDFVGREDKLAVLSDAFIVGGRPSTARKRKSFVVFGMGGSGKTQLCSKFAQDNRDIYSAVYTVHAASHETIRDSFRQIGRLGGLEATESAGQHFLSQLTEPCLLIVDNADDPSLENDIRRVFPLSDTAHILITTRNPDFRQEGTLGSLELKGLNEEEALRLLLTKADIPKPWDGVTTKTAGLIAKALGYLALALIHAGNCIYRRICELGEYLDLHSDSRSHRVLPGVQADEKNLVHAVYSTFDVSLDYLSNLGSERGLDALALLKIISFYHFESIPVALFKRAVASRQHALGEITDTSLSSRLRNAIISRLEPPRLLPHYLISGKPHVYRIGQALSELHSLSLISYDDSTTRSFSMHPLVHAWARDSIPTAEQSTWATIAFNTLMESVSLPSEGRSDSDGDFHRDILPHLNVCQRDEQEDPLSRSVRGLGPFQIRCAKLFQPTFLFIVREQILNSAKCGYVFAERGHFARAAIHLEWVKQTLLLVLGQEHEKTQSAMLGLAGVFWGLGRLEEAIKLQKSVFETRSKVLGRRDEQTLQAMNQLGRSYWLHGQYREALDIQKTCTEHMKKELGPEHPQTLEALDNLGVVLGAWHRFPESLHIHQEVLEARKTKLGETHLDTLMTMGNTAMAMLDIGYMEKARSIMTTVYEQRQRQLGKEHPWTLWALCYLAKIYNEMGLLQDAEDILTWGIEAGIRSLSKDHLGVLIGSGELARTYSRQGKLNEALKLSLETIALVEKSRGIAHPDCVYGLWKLAMLYEKRKEYKNAIQTCELALERAAMRLGMDHPMARKIENLLQSVASPVLVDAVSHGHKVEHTGPIAEPTIPMIIRHQQTW